MREKYVIANSPRRATKSMCGKTGGAADLILTVEDLAAIDAEFPPPNRKMALQML